MEESTKKDLRTFLPWIFAIIFHTIVIMLVTTAKNHTILAYSIVLYLIFGAFFGLVWTFKNLPYAYLWLDKKIKEIWG